MSVSAQSPSVHASSLHTSSVPSAPLREPSAAASTAASAAASTAGQRAWPWVTGLLVFLLTGLVVTSIGRGDTLSRQRAAPISAASAAASTPSPPPAAVVPTTTPPADSAMHRSTYLMALQEHRITYAALTPMLDLGQLVCRSLARGQSVPSVTRTVSAYGATTGIHPGGYSPTEAGHVIEAAVGGFCPEFAPRVP
jgi:Protein of unknown function (DUF732)